MAQRDPRLWRYRWARFMGMLYDIGYDGPVCIEVEDDTFGKTLAGRKQAVRVAVTSCGGTRFFWPK